MDHYKIPHKIINIISANMSSTGFKMLSLVLFLMVCCRTTELGSGLSEVGAVRAAYWMSFGDFPADMIDTSYFTHVYYAFLHPDPNTFELVVTQLDQKNLPELIGAKSNSVKTVISIAGNNTFAELSRTKAGRAAFIESTIKVARQYGYDGLDLDWEYPANDEQMLSLGELFADWRNALENEAKASGKPRLTLSSAVYFSSKFTYYGSPRSYPANMLAKYLDWVSPMCYDYHGSWDKFTGANAALYDPNSNISTSSGIRSWINAGVAADKIVMGLPMYGVTWKLQNPNVNHMGAPAIGVGTLKYNEVIEFNKKNSATVKYDPVSVSYYSYVGDTWIGYDDVPSIASKVEFAKSQGLGGYFFWAIGQDLNWALSKGAAEAWGK